MDHLTQLPEELLLCISEFFLYSDLAALSSTCRKLNSAVLKRLQHHKSLKQQYTLLCDSSWPQSGLNLGWFDVLARLLRGAYPPEYVSTIRLTACPWYWNELSTLSHLTRKSTQIDKPYNDEDMNVVVRAALSSPWIYRDGSHPCGPRSAAHDMRELVFEIKEGDMDNILAILLPLLPNLERLELAPGLDGVVEEDQPSSHWLGSVPGVVKRIASQSLDPSRKHELLRIQNPAPYAAFQNLRYLLYDFRATSEMLYATSFHDLLPWMSLPSLRTVDMYEACDHPFRWPDDAEKSHVEVIKVYNSGRHGVSLSTMIELAKGMQGDCLITQHDYRGNLHPAGERASEWQSLKVLSEGTISICGGSLPSP